MDIPPLKSHYALMHAQEETIQRHLPMAVVTFHMHLKLVHSGETAESVLAMDDASFGTFLSQGFEIACDPGLLPYQRDAALGVAFGPNLFQNALVNTENIVSTPLNRRAVFVSSREFPRFGAGRRASARYSSRGARSGPSSPSPSKRGPR
jgi:hypothetical protein